jgi:hypothetical protein
MPPRKPPDVSFESWIDTQIREARERGDFDELPGRGEPLRNLDEAADPAWWAKQLARREGISLLPPALEIRRRVERLLEGLAGLWSEREVREAVAALNAEIRRLNARSAGGPPTTQAPLDADDVTARWRARREG